jgi:fructuronate reductase
VTASASPLSSALSSPRLSRAGAPAAPVRILHLGLGNFFRAHQAFYTATAPDAADWGIAAYTGRSAALADALAAQGGLFTLITRGADVDTAQVIASISRAHSGSDQPSWLAHLSDPAVVIVTLTVTEAGYVLGPDGRLDVGHADITADLVALRAEPTAPVRTAPARLVAGLAARRAAGGGPLAVVSCDNLPDNGAVVATVVDDFAARLDPTLAEWIARYVSYVTTMVDRITPATAASDADTALALTGRLDAAPVVTEPFREWVLCGEFPAGRPAWDEAGAHFVDDIRPYEQRKLWLLNGGHSLLAYAGSGRGHTTVAEAVADPVCRSWLEAWWDEAAAYLTLPTADLDAYRAALIGRFGNARIRHLLAQIATDGSRKIPIRVLPTIAGERAAGRLPTAGLRILAAWIVHLRGAGVAVRDVDAVRLSELVAGSLEDAVPAVLDYLDDDLAADAPLVDAVITLARALATERE